MHILLQHVRACTCACHAVLMCGLCVQVAEQLPRVQLTGCEAIFVHAEWDIDPTTEQAALHTLPSLLAPLLPSTATLSLSWPTASRRLAATLRELAAAGWGTLALSPNGRKALAAASQISLPPLHTVQLHRLTNKLAKQLRQCAQPGSSGVLKVDRFELQSALPQGAAPPWRTLRLISDIGEGLGVEELLAQARLARGVLAWELDELRVVRTDITHTRTHAHTHMRNVCYPLCLGD